MICWRKSNGTHLAAHKRSKEIDKKIRKDRKTMQGAIKLLLLGTGDSGKSTFCKQMTILHKNGFPENQVMSYVAVLRDNTLESMRILLAACLKWGIQVEENMESVVDEVMAATQLTEDIAELVFRLWGCEFVQKAYERRHLTQLPGGASVTPYYFENAVRFAQADFKPNDEDIVRAKIRTIGVHETPFSVGGNDFVLIDVGGQRSERSKWLPCFNDVFAVIYLAALNEYDMLMDEDNKTNRMEESIKLFQKINVSSWLKEVPFILFLNKSDLLEEKIKTRPLSQSFEDFDQFASSLDQDPLQTSCEYIKSLYSRVFNGSRLYSFVTNALDRTNCNKVFDAVRNEVITSVISDTF